MGLDPVSLVVHLFELVQVDLFEHKAISRERVHIAHEPRRVLGVPEFDAHLAMTDSVPWTAEAYFGAAP